MSAVDPGRKIFFDAQMNVHADSSILVCRQVLELARRNSSTSETLALQLFDKMQQHKVIPTACIGKYQTDSDC